LKIFIFTNLVFPFFRCQIIQAFMGPSLVVFFDPFLGYLFYVVKINSTDLKELLALDDESQGV